MANFVNRTPEKIQKPVFFTNCERKTQKMQDNFKDKTKWFDKPYEYLKEIKIK